MPERFDGISVLHLRHSLFPKGKQEILQSPSANGLEKFRRLQRFDNVYNIIISQNSTFFNIACKQKNAYKYKDNSCFAYFVKNKMIFLVYTKTNLKILLTKSSECGIIHNVHEKVNESQGARQRKALL